MLPALVLRALLLLMILRDPSEIARDPAARAAFWKLMAKTRFGFSHQEAAAFVVRDMAGSLSLVEWPMSEQPDAARWEGPYPKGTVAIVHTHPNWLSMPSTVDIASARRTGVPIYVITRSIISKTNGGPPQVVVSGEWRPK